MLTFETLENISKTSEHYNNLSSEAYFGKSGNLAIIILDMVKSIRSLVLEIDNTGIINYVQNQGLYKKKLSIIQEKYGKEISKTINVENTYISIIEEANAAALPCAFDSELMSINKDSGKLEYNEKREIQLNDVIVKSDGYRFKNGDKISFLIFIGLGLFDKRTKMTDEEITGIMLHEIGHSFQHTVLQINVNIACCHRIQFIQYLSRIINNFLGNIGGMIGVKTTNAKVGESFFNLDDKTIPGFLTIISILSHIGMVIISPLKNLTKGEKDAGHDYMKADVNRPQQQLLIDRKVTGEILKSNSLTVIPKMIFKKISDVMDKILFIPIFIARQLIKVAILSQDLMQLAPIQTLANAFILITNAKFLTKNKTAEEFADSFATFYGYGPQVASGLMKLHRISTDVISVVNSNKDYGIGNIVYLVPGVNIYLTILNQFNIRVQQLMFGYPVLRERVAGNFKVLQNELNTNKTLTPKQKKDILEQMEELRKLYDDLVYSKNLSNLVYLIYAKIVNKQIENEKTSVEKNVLSVINETIAQNIKKVPKTNTKMMSFISKLQSGGANFLQSLGSQQMQLVTSSAVENYKMLKMLDIEVRVNGKELSKNSLSNASFEGYNIDEKGKLFIYYNK